MPGVCPCLQDHYKLALGQINMCRNLIDRICQVGRHRLSGTAGVLCSFLPGAAARALVSRHG